MAFGTFDEVCDHSLVPVCPLLPSLYVPDCYARTATVGETVLMEPSVLTIQVIAVFMTLIIIFQLGAKKAAVGNDDWVAAVTENVKESTRCYSFSMRTLAMSV